jgi:hypothetical protein
MVVSWSLVDLVILTMVTVSTADDLIWVICLNAEIRQFLGSHKNKNLNPHLQTKLNM